MIKPEEIITEAQLIEVHANANFGPQTLRDVVNENTLKVALGYHIGSTATAILRDHGLIYFRYGRKSVLSPKGKRYLIACVGRNFIPMFDAMSQE